MASSSTGAGNTSDPMGKLGIGLVIWVTPLQVGAGRGVSLPPPADEMGRGNFLQFSEASLSEGRGEDAWQRVTTALPPP